ncbi:MAG: hypothetical protein LBB67_01980 [Oscillospiraceae bacterium]|jgi:hypothetical protein|nr:hypothetical protein [Oscillospiraceae bacterium]
MKTKKFALCIVPLLLLFSCTLGVKTTLNWYQVLFPQGIVDTFPVLSDDGMSLFYLRRGIWRYDMATAVTKPLVDDPLITEFCLGGDTIYYLKDTSHVEHDEQIKEEKLPLIFGVHVIGGESWTVWTADMLNEDFNFGIGNAVIADLKYNGGSLIFADSGVSFIAYNLHTKQTARLVENATSCALIGSEVFYLERFTFSIYKRNFILTESTPTLVVGSGQVIENGQEADFDLYDQVVVVDGRIFVARRNPAQVFEISADGKLSIVAENTEHTDVEMFVGKHKLYYHFELTESINAFDLPTSTSREEWNDPALRKASNFHPVLDRLFFTLYDDAEGYVCQSIL